MLAALAALVAVLFSPVASAQTQSDIEVKDQLIAKQENLLNTYRCLYRIDVDVVPGGCPNPDAIASGSAPENPAQQDIDVRDGLIQSQEALLNVYRCYFDVESLLLPSGCPGHVNWPYIGLDWDFRFWRLFSIENIDGPYVDYRLYGEDDSQFFLRGRPNLLAMLCGSGTEIGVYFTANKFIPYDQLVQMSFKITGMNTPVTEQWWNDSAITSNWGPKLFSPDGGGLENVLSRYSTGTLSVSASTDNGRITWWKAEFIIDGVDAVIESLGQECGA